MPTRYNPAEDSNNKTFVNLANKERTMDIVVPVFVLFVGVVLFTVVKQLVKFILQRRRDSTGDVEIEISGGTEEESGEETGDSQPHPRPESPKGDTIDDTNGDVADQMPEKLSLVIVPEVEDEESAEFLNNVSRQQSPRPFMPAFLPSYHYENDYYVPLRPMFTISESTFEESDYEDETYGSDEEGDYEQVEMVTSV